MIQDKIISDNMPSGNITINELKADIANNTLINSTRAIEKAHTERNSFPVEVFPLRAQEYVKGAKTALGIPSDFFAASMIFAAASAAGNTWKLEIKKGVEQKAVFYLVLVGLPNSNKSGALKTAINPVLKQDAANYQEYKSKKSEYETIKGLSKKERKEQNITEVPPPPIFNRTIIQDATPEAVAGALQDSPRGITVYRDELAGFIKDFNRYNQGGEQEFWLSNWTGINLSIDRKTSEPIRIKNPFISIVGTIQPGVIESLAKDNRAVNGFIDRFLFVWPEGLKKAEWTEEEINLPLVEAYETAINKLLGVTFDEDNNARILTLTSEARRRLFKFYNEDNKQFCDEAENELLAGIYGKFDFHTARFIIAIHLIRWAYSEQEEPPPQIELKTVVKAIKVAKYFRSQALKVYNSIHSTSPVEKLPADKRRLYEALPEVFKKGDGETISTRMGIPKRTFRDFLTKNKGILFDKIKYGEYSKIY